MRTITPRLVEEEFRGGVWFLQKSLTHLVAISSKSFNKLKLILLSKLSFPFQTRHVYRASMRISCQIANKQKTKNYRLTTLKFGMIQKSETKMHPLKSLQKTNKKSVEDTKPWKDGVLKSWVAIMLCSFEFVVEKKLPAGDFLMIWKSWKSLKIHFSTVFPLEIAKKFPPAAGKISPKIFYRSIFMETFSLSNHPPANAEPFYKNCRPKWLKEGGNGTGEEKEKVERH